MRIQIHLPTGILINIGGASSFRHSCVLVSVLVSFSKEHTFWWSWNRQSLLSHGRLFSNVVVPNYNLTRSVSKFPLLCILTGIWYHRAFNFHCCIDIDLFAALIWITNYVESVSWPFGYPLFFIFSYCSFSIHTVIKCT